MPFVLDCQARADDRVFASIALHDPDLAAADLATAVREDGAAGLVLSTNPYHVRDLTDPRLEPVWSARLRLITVHGGGFLP
jgi:predicted TIM-barrel fold metal-dependent hydrolase